MKIFTATLLLSALLLTAGCSAKETTLIQNAVSEKSITVTGEGKAQVKPDTAVISVEVITLMKEGSKESQAKNNQLSESVIGGLVANGVSKESIATTQYSVRRQERTQQYNIKVFEGWNTTHVFDVTVPYDSVKDILNRIVIGDEVNIRNVKLSVTNRTSAEQAARKAAVENSLVEAQELANAAGVEIGDVIDMTEGRVRITSTPTCTECGGGGGDINLSDGTKELIYNVTVAYTIK